MKIQETKPDPFKDQKEYLPWEKKTEEEVLLQNEWQDALCEGMNVHFGDNCTISRRAAFFPSRFRCGENCMIAAEALIRGDIEMGRECTVNSYTVIAGKVRMGDHVRIASNTSIFGFNHGHKDTHRPIHGQKHTSDGITVEDDVWIGANVMIVDGVTIGAHSILAGGAVITKDVPPYSVMGGNPARRIRDRRVANPGGGKREAALRSFGERVREEVPSVLEEAYDQESGIYVDNQQDRKPTSRAWCDAVEIAGFINEVPSHFGKEFLIDKLQSYQNPETGCFDRDLKGEASPLQRVEKNGYDYLAIGYALEVLGSHLPHKNRMLDQVTPEALVEAEKKRPWVEQAWGAGSWNDHFGTAVYHDRNYHGATYDLSTQFGWLNLKCSRTTGLWGEPTKKQGWLQPVNGFYRLTRGTYAQFGQPLPYPVDAIDTILMHCRQYDNFLERNVTACNVLDIVHPLWLCAKQTDHRNDEIRSLMESQVDVIMDRWIPNRGFAFSADHPPGLQGTEMWLSILYIATDYLGLSKVLGYRPKGVHRTEVALLL